MSNPSAPSDKPALVDIIHDWLGQQGLRKIWGIKVFDFFDNVKIADLFLRDLEPTEDWEGVPYFRILPYRVEDKSCFGPVRFSVSVYDPEFFIKLREALDYREASNTIICRCPQCEGVKR